MIIYRDPNACLRGELFRDWGVLFLELHLESRTRLTPFPTGRVFGGRIPWQ
jgi:hypothetical protein